MSSLACMSWESRLAAPVLLLGLLVGCSGSQEAVGPSSSASQTRAAPTARADVGAPPHTTTPSPTYDAQPAPSGLQPSEPFGIDQVTLTNGATTIPVAVYVADTPSLRSRGLMERESLAPGTGMVFLYADEATGGYWMRNTLVPLSIAFADASGDILAIFDMDPCEALPCPTYGPDQPYRTALEVPQGWFAANGIDAGWRLTDVPST